METDLGWSFPRHSYIRKHLRLIPSYVRLGFKRAIEYKFNVITNFVQFLVSMSVWIFFWTIVINRLHEIGQWKLPMLLMLVGFYYMNDGLWQFGWYSIGLIHEVYKGRIVTTMVKPVGVVYGTVMKELQVFPILPTLAGFGLALTVFIKYYSVAFMWKFALALVMGMIFVMIVHFIYIFTGAMSFWVGKTMLFRTLIRSFQISRSYPIDILSANWRAFLTFVVPYAFAGTMPVLVATQYSAGQILKILGIEIIVASAWGAIAFFTWRAGLRRFEAFGG